MMGPDGEVQFMFGLEQPAVICAVMRVTDIQLQGGEVVRNVYLGDTHRWIVEQSVSGIDNTPHLIVKPRDIGLETSMVAITDRRSYHFRLKSSRDEYMARVSFVYADEATRKFEGIRLAADDRRQLSTIEETNEYLGDLDFNYRVTGRARWAPVRVYSDGVKTICEMPARVRQGDAPSFLVIRKEGRAFRKTEPEIVNYRMQGNRYVVDAVFDKAIMVVGVGASKEQVTIEYVGKGRQK